MNNIRVLIVDDQMPMRQILKTLLNKAGYKVVAEATNGQKAIELNRAFKPDLICLDITMPGLDTLKVLKQDHPEAIVVMVTGHSNRKDIEAAVEAGASGYIVKPINIGRMLQTIKFSVKQKGWRSVLVKVGHRRCQCVGARQIHLFAA